jgi:hypothetical protein
MHMLMGICREIRRPANKIEIEIFMLNKVLHNLSLSPNMIIQARMIGRACSMNGVWGGGAKARGKETTGKSFIQ